MRPGSSGSAREQAIERLSGTLNGCAPSAAVTLMLVGVDRFRLVNDAWGPAVGDEMIEAVELRLVEVAQADLVTWLGADEFLLAYVDLGRSWAVQEAQRIRHAFGPAVVVDGRPVRVSVSIGLAEAGPYARTESLDLLGEAGAALHLAKSRGGDQLAWFEPSLSQEAARRLELEAALGSCLDRDELSLHYQPVCRVADGQIVGAEALLRWCRPDSGSFPPDEFVPILEDTGLILAVGEWVLTHAMAQLQAWRRSGVVSESFTLAVNISPRQLVDPALVELIRRSLHDNQIDVANLTLEITETAAGSERPEIVTAIHALAALGVGVSIDDFGTGYSSLALLRLLPVTQLKIDKQLVLPMTTEPRSTVLTAALIDLAHDLALTCVAEGVEDAAQLGRLRDLGCDFAQGFYLGRPVPAADFTTSENHLRSAAEAAADGRRRPQLASQHPSVPMFGGAVSG